MTCETKDEPWAWSPQEEQQEDIAFKPCIYACCSKARMPGEYRGDVGSSTDLIVHQLLCVCPFLETGSFEKVPETWQGDVVSVEVWSSLHKLKY